MESFISILLLPYFTIHADCDRERYIEIKGAGAVSFSWILFGLAALTVLLGRIIGKGGIALLSFSVGLCCAGVASCILCGGTVVDAATGVLAVTVSVLLSGKGGRKG